MKKILFSTVAISVLAMSANASQADFLKNSSLGADVGTTGIGVTYVHQLQEYKNWAVRVGAHKYTKNYTTSDNKANYDFDLKLQDAQLMADYHPWMTSFKWTFGAGLNGTKLDGKITPSGGFDIGGKHYTSAELGGVNTKVDFDNDIAPYVGIGWDTSFNQPSKKWGFTFNLGVFYLGKAKVSYSPYNIAAGVDTVELNNRLAKEKASLEDDLKDFKYLPYISIGFNYKF